MNPVATVNGSSADRLQLRRVASRRRRLAGASLHDPCTAPGEHEELNALTDKIIGAALEVHHELGPGLLENAYDECFAVELAARGLTIERQKALPVIYKNQRVDCGYRLDFIIERRVIVDVKAVEASNGCTQFNCSRTYGSRGVRSACCSISTPAISPGTV